MARAGRAEAVIGVPAGALFERLRALRRALADAEGVPAYIVFSDAVLARMAAEQPSDEAGLLAVSGVGPAKLARYDTRRAELYTALGDTPGTTDS